ncbi:MAG TPA: hypothetical protein VJZ00_12585 [Thermoanaerobaculia bacterium]|nr:hypothetical protein [Thermoanaerobaculia bacterium]
MLEKIRAIAGEICERDGIQGAMGYSAEYLYLSRHFPVYEELLGGLHSIRDGVVREDQIVQLLAKARAVLAALPV